MNRFLSLFFLFLFNLSAWAFEVPALTGPVVGPTTLFKESWAAQELTYELISFKQQTGIQLQVLIVPSLNNEAIESVAIQVFDKWKLGDEKKDNGILFLIAPNEKQMRIEVGQGLEGVLPDVIAKRIISDIVRPQFQKGEMYLGVVQGVKAIEHYAQSDSKDVQNTNTPQGKIPVSYLVFGFLGIFIVIFIFSPALAIQIILALLSGGRGGRGGYGGGSGGGGWSGGGGSSSGGGSSGSW